MFFNEREIFVGIGIFILIGGLIGVLFSLSPSEDDFSEGKSLEDTNGILDKIRKGITGNVINLDYENLEDEKDYCGDDYCYKTENGDYENCENCPQDCGSCGSSNECGDSICSNGDCENCFSDCSFIECENGICEGSKKENCGNSPNDCSCSGDSYCENEVCVSLSCGNGDCESSKGEDCQSCKQDCGACDCSVLGGVSCEIGKECNGKVKDGCCLGSCEWSWKYPLVFVHGYSTSEGDSMYSLSAFEEFQNKLVSDKFYEGRTPIIASNDKIDFKKNKWANTQLPISIRTTYYYGEYSVGGGFTYDDNNQDIEEYARRLGKVVDLVRYTTGREKVDIIAHSMGGLVSREYVRQTEGKYVNKLVTIGTPNNGIYGTIAFGCGKNILGFGRKYTPECEDMQHGSTFLDKLNKEDRNYKKYLTIAGKSKRDEEDWGSFCPNSQGDHDGVICASSVLLDGAKNEEILGGKSIRIHSLMIRPSEFSEVYNKVVEFLDE